MGRIKIISTSNNKKIKIILKNWREKGFRGLKKGSNPHSKEKFFSFSFKKRLLNSIIIKKQKQINKLIKNNIIFGFPMVPSKSNAYTYTQVFTCNLYPRDTSINDIGRVLIKVINNGQLKEV